MWMLFGWDDAIRKRNVGFDGDGNLSNGDWAHSMNVRVNSSGVRGVHGDEVGKHGNAFVFHSYLSVISRNLL
jgi:hypothetical protein